MRQWLSGQPYEPSRKLANQAGSGVGGEADADPVGAGADVDAGGVRMLDGQSFDLGGLPLPQGFALDLGPGLATAVGLAVGLSLSWPAAGRRGGGRLVSGRGYSHGRAPQTRRGEGIGGHAPRRCAGESAGIRSRLQTGTTLPGRSPRVGVTSE